jgi:Zn-dependent protease with chaperone function
MLPTPEPIVEIVPPAVVFPPKARQSLATLFSTDPPLEARLAALDRLEAQLQGTA